MNRNREQELLLEHLTLTHANPEPSGPEQGRQRWVGGGSPSINNFSHHEGRLFRIIKSKK